LAHLYRQKGEDFGQTLGKTYGINARCYWEHPWGTHWEPREDIGNLMGTHWENSQKSSTCGKFAHFVRKMDKNENIFKEITRVILTKDIGMNIKTLSTRGMPFSSQTCS
jgi:ABC-type transporter lipoprotein component MlaA